MVQAVDLLARWPLPTPSVLAPSVMEAGRAQVTGHRERGQRGTIITIIQCRLSGDVAWEDHSPLTRRRVGLCQRTLHLASVAASESAGRAEFCRYLSNVSAGVQVAWRTDAIEDESVVRDANSCGSADRGLYAGATDSYPGLYGLSHKKL